MTKVVPTALVGAVAIFTLPGAPRIKCHTGEALKLTDNDLAVGWGPCPVLEQAPITESDIMAWLVANEYTTIETKEPFQRMNKSLYNTPEGLRITYTWDRESGFVWEKDHLTGERNGWYFIGEPTSEGYQLKVSGHGKMFLTESELVQSLKEAE